MTLTRDQLDTLKKLHEAATPGPWWRDTTDYVMGPDDPDGYCSVEVALHTSRQDANLIAFLGTHRAALIEMAEDAIKWRELCDCVVEGQYTTLNYEDREIVMTARNK